MKLRLTVNGLQREVEPETSIAVLLEELDIQDVRIAVEHNRAILPRDRYADTLLQDGDQVEIVQFVGGG